MTRPAFAELAIIAPGWSDLPTSFYYVGDAGAVYRWRAGEDFQRL